MARHYTITCDPKPGETTAPRGYKVTSLAAYRYAKRMRAYGYTNVTLWLGEPGGELVARLEDKAATK